MPQPHVDDLLTLRIPIKDENGNALDVSAASTLQIKFQKPSAANVTKTATVVPGDSTAIEYQFLAAELDEAGLWQAQPVITGLADWTGHGEVVTFTVDANLS